MATATTRTHDLDLNNRQPDSDCPTPVGDALPSVDCLGNLVAPLLLVALRLTRCLATAQDLVADSIVSLIVALPGYDPQRGTLEGLGRRILVNKAIDRHRRKRSRPLSSDLFANSEAPGQQVERDDDADAIDGALARLPPGLRTLVVLRFFHEIRYKQIAEMCTCLSARW